MATYDAIQEFQSATNPGPAWGYGYSEQGGANYAFIPFDRGTPGDAISWTMSNYEISGTPTAWRNLQAADRYGVKPGQLSLHPGPRPDGDFAVLRFTAPKTTGVKITGQFFAGDIGPMSGRVVRNGDFDHPLQLFQVTTDTSVFDIPVLAVRAGDTLDFIVGNNGNFNCGNTPLAVSIEDAVAQRSTALVLSGGGARGDFQLGAIQCLYERARVPNIICGTSVGAINALKLAEGEDPANPAQGLSGLDRIWRSLQTNDDMYLAEAWLSDPGMNPDLARYLKGQSTSFDVAGPVPSSPALGVFGMLADAISSVAFLLGPGAELLTSLKIIATEARGLFNLTPILQRLKADSDLALVRAWADRGNRLRLATVALDSGRLRYVTERGALIERDGTPVIDPAAVAPACAMFANDLDGLLAKVAQLQDEIAEAQQELADAAPGAKGNLATQIRTSNARLAALSDQVAVQRKALAACMAGHPQDFVLPDMHVGALASASIPGVFLPVQLGAEHYVDGGVQEVAPIQAAVDLGATDVFVVHASSRTLPTYVTPPNAGLVGIVSRAMVDLAIDEVDRSDRLLVADANAARANVVHIEPEADLHSIMTIDPGLVQISRDYGYMRAADKLDGVGGDTAALALQISQLRVSIWSMENAGAGQPDPMKGTPASPADLTMAPRIAAGKATLRGLIQRRRDGGGAMRADIDRWTVDPELHPWLVDTVNDAAFVSQIVPAAIPAGETAAASITMRNTGTSTWQAGRGYALGSQDPQDNTSWGTDRWPLPGDVGPGATVTFTRDIPAPQAAGTSFRWRMVQQGVGFFGAASTAVAVGIGPTPEPAVCDGLRKRIADLQEAIQEKEDALSGDPRTDAGIRRQILALQASLASVTKDAQANNCRLP